MRIALGTLLICLCACGASADAVFKRGSGATGSGLNTYSETRSPVSGSDPGDTGENWWNETDNTFFFCEDGATDAWISQPEIACAAITDAVTIATAEDTFIFKVPYAALVTRVDCITVGGTSAQATVQECDSAGANCTTTEAALTCDTNSEGTASIDDANVDSGDWMRLEIGTVTGSVTSLDVCVTYRPR